MDGEQPAMSANIQVDERRTPQRVREAVQEMLKYGLLEESHKPNLYRSALTNIEVVDRILEPLDLAMGVDEVRGLVFVTVRQGEVAEQDDWSHPLVRRQRLNLEQSLLIAILRQHFIAYEQESGTGASQALVAVDELIPQLQVYLGELGSEAKERNRIITLLDQLKGHGLVSALDAHDRVIIRPIITHLANPENLQALVVWLREQVEGAVTPAAGGEEDEA
ncbi:TPA: DUF4194 domain-containing protein [Pseudomonas aeruginosa]|nr:hypothetical protein HW04_18795 [Pseudomonas aeruginosa]OHO92747.1 hypothetical protein HMPREF2581_05035 [Pseudomonas sp. HMSC057H01]QDL67878.1 DUF4194 domain-containing protein [Pseudomonas aeruginosa UCBPP-PA14]UOD97249.1 DUF4194 domain-containing protein [Pseudomonas aeruginosa CI27]ASM88762.1 hypothetical protein BWR11_01350 [Pseudomonas aeruginosa]